MCQTTLCLLIKRKVTMSTLEEKAAYLLGMHVANQNIVPLIQQFKIDPKLLLQGATDMLSGAEPKEDPSTIEAVMNEMQAIAEKSQGEAAEAGAAHMAEIAKKDGITVTESGLAYEVVEVAEGDKPAATDNVTVHYEGTLIDGSIFDSSIKRGEPASFPLNQVIPGWTEGLQLMSVGSKFRFHIPSELAYGESAPPSIGPNQALIFDVELISIGD
ncbi:MAG: FKBP-type peptidyl-prolyl cis-trans isomerase [Planctomycetes bacterium]|nr:FKBP-type peptidyl-prolyl cis-trans isomerase [Planctomycetota bacterium]